MSCCKKKSAHEALMSAPAMQVMASLEAIDVKEKVNHAEALSAAFGAEVEMANKYKISNHKNGVDVFFAVEKTGLLQRQLQTVCGDCAPWELDIVYTEGTRRDLAFKIERPWTCTCCCCNRPTVEIRDIGTNRLIGTIKDPPKCCTAMKFKMWDGSDNLVGTASTPCLQCGLCCSCPCGPCSRIHLTVRDKWGKKTGSMYRQIPGCCKFCCCPDVDNYHVEFDKDMDPVAKVLLMALAIFMDFRYFNNNPLDRRKDGPQDSALLE